LKNLLVTTPIRPIPTNFPPIGSLSLINYLRENGEELDFYHIDALRPSYEDAIAHIIELAPDVLGVSSVVSTAYAYTKRLVEGVKAALPDTLVIVGGSLAASAEVLLRRTGVDLCALGEGEKVMLNVVQRAKTTRNPAEFSDIPGLMLLDGQGNVVNTGYEDQLDKDQLYNVNWDDLEQASDISTYISPAFVDGKIDTWFESDKRCFEAHRQNKMVGSLAAAKGCVAKCTFCHRWDKGIRYIPPEIIRQRVQELIDRYDVGFLNIVDENFGTDVKWLKKFCAAIKPMDILWRVAGMRVNCISQDRIELMKNAGCVSILYGMETGSERMLQVMEKKVKLQDNYNAMQWTVEANMKTVVQFVVGMPGETPSTIDESAKFASFANSLESDQRPWDLSINFAQALPGTPLYEHARRMKLIDPSLDGEEKYLLRISDHDAADEQTTINFTAYPFCIQRSWRQRLQLKTTYHNIQRYGKANYARMLLEDTRYFQRQTSEETGYFNKPKQEVERTLMTDTLHDGRDEQKLDNQQLPSFFSLIRKRRLGLALLCYPERFRVFIGLLPYYWFLIGVRQNGLLPTLKEIYQWLSGDLKKIRGEPTQSLRKIVFKESAPPAEDTPAMASLRRGR
jgi:anaerobic magnesium-protoporphyrin IX monomethyl ester cyclase